MHENLTPTEELVGELLAARYRLGEKVWTLGSRQWPAVRRLEKRGLVFAKSGVMEKTILAGLTEKGLAEFLDPTYVPPVFLSPWRDQSLMVQ